MHLRDRRARDRRLVERPEDFIHRLAVQPGERGLDLGERKRRHAVLELRELVGDVRRQEIAPGGEHLAELDEDRTELLECQAQTLRTRRRSVAPERQRTRRGTNRAEPLVTGQKLVEPVLERYNYDLGEPREAHLADCKG